MSFLPLNLLQTGGVVALSGIVVVLIDAVVA
jgi:hypothetical protein